MILYQFLDEVDAIELAERVTAEDEEIREVMKLVAELCGVQEEGSRRKFRRLHRGELSVCSSRDSLTDSSVRSSRARGKERKQNDRKYRKRCESQASYLREKFIDLQEIFKAQKRVCEEIINAKDPITSGREILKLEETYQTMTNAAFRWREQLPSVEANDIDLQMEEEDADVFEVNKTDGQRAM